MADFLRFTLLILLLSFHALFAEGGADPWFSGSLLTYSARVLPPGEMSIQPYLFITRLPGTYNSHSNLISNRNTHQYQLLAEFKAGLIPRVDCKLDIHQIYSQSATRGHAYYGKADIYLGFQLLTDNPHSVKPDLRIMVGQTVPLGKSEHPNATLKETSLASPGASATTAVLVMRKVFCAHGSHPFNWTLNFSYLMPRTVVVKGVTQFGGNENTRGRVHPGVLFELDLAYEYKFNKPWGVAVDIYGQYQTSGTFDSANPAAPAPSLASSYSFSLAPAIEYNFNDHLSAIAGPWFSVAGRNSNAFYSGVASVYYRF